MILSQYPTSETERKIQRNIRPLSHIVNKLVNEELQFPHNTHISKYCLCFKCEVKCHTEHPNIQTRGPISLRCNLLYQKIEICSKLFLKFWRYDIIIFPKTCKKALRDSAAILFLLVLA